MNHSECKYEPYTCEGSQFFEDIHTFKDRIIRWIECIEYYYDADGILRWKETGVLCPKKPVDWWETYKAMGNGSNPLNRIPGP